MEPIPSHQEIEVVNGIMGHIIHPDFADPDHPQCAIGCENLSPDEFTELLRRDSRYRMLAMMARFGSIEATVFGQPDYDRAGREGLYFNEVPEDYANTVLHGDGSDILLISAQTRNSSTIVTGRKTGVKLLNHSVGKQVNRGRNRNNPLLDDARLLLSKINGISPLCPSANSPDPLADCTKDLGDKLCKALPPEDFLKLNGPITQAIRRRHVHEIPWKISPGQYKAAFIAKRWLHARYAPTLTAINESSPVEWTDLRYS